MKKKLFWKSKTLWSGLGTIAVSVFALLRGNIPEGILGITTGIGTIAGRAAAKTEIVLTKEE